MGKTVFTCRDSNGNVIEDSIVVKLVMYDSPYTEYTGTLDPPVGNSNGTRIFVDLPEGDYNLEFNGVVQTNVSPLFIAGVVGIPALSIPAGYITGSMIAGLTITQDKIDDLTIEGAKIANGTITNAKLAYETIGASKIASGSISKAKLDSDIFATRMQDLSGWQPKVDGSTIGWNLSNELEVVDGSIDEQKVQDDSVSAIKIQDGAVTGFKIGTSAISAYHVSAGSIIESSLATGAVTGSKIGTGVIIAEHIADGIISGIKLGTSIISAEHIVDGSITAIKIGTSTITANNLDQSLQENLTVRYPTDMVFVSPQFITNSAPYFDNIADALTYVLANGMKTIYIYPGIYLESLTIQDSISLIGADADKCVISLVPSSGIYTTILVNNIGSDHVYISNLTIKCISDNSESIPSIGVKTIDTIAKSIILKNVYIKVTGQNSITDPQDATGIFCDNAKVICDDVHIEVKGGDHLDGGTGADAYGFHSFSVDDNISFRGRILSKQGTGGTAGKGYGIAFEEGSTEILIEKTTIESDDDGLYSGSAIVPVVISTEYKSVASTNVSTSKFVNVTQNTNVKVKEMIDS